MLYTKQELIEKRQFLISELQRFYKENGRSPIASEMSPKNGYPAMGSYVYYFSFFNNALKIAELEINKIRCEFDGTETCSYCGKKANEIVGFVNWRYNKKENNKRYCNRCGNSSGIFDYVKGILDINSTTGCGRAGEICVIKTLKIGTEHDCALISMGYPFDLYHDDYKKINVKTSFLSNDYNKWNFNFNAKKEADTYICLGMSSDRKNTEYVWIVPNEGKFRDLTGFQISNGKLALINHKYWEVDLKIYNDSWQEMLVNYTDGNCKVFGKKIEEEWTEEQEESYQQFKKEFLERHKR